MNTTNTRTSTPVIVLAEHRAGRRTLTLPTTPYMEEWAKRYQRAQAAIERDRLRRGLAKHRAHRMTLKSVPPKNVA